MGASNSAEDLNPPAVGSPAVEKQEAGVAVNDSDSNVRSDDCSDAGSSVLTEGSRAGSCRRLARLMFGGSENASNSSVGECRPGTCNIVGPRLSASDYECIERLERSGQKNRAARLRQSRQTLTAPERRCSVKSNSSGSSAYNSHKTKGAPSHLALTPEVIKQKRDRLKDLDGTSSTVYRRKAAEAANEDSHLSAVASSLNSVVPSAGEDKGSLVAPATELGLMLDDVGAPVFTNDSEQTSRGFIWNASRILLYYFQSPQQSSWFHGKRVLEFGSGLGHLGYGLAKLGAQVTCSEHRGSFPLLKVNLVDLEAQHGSVAEKGGSLRAVELNWGENGYRESILSTEFEAGAPPFDVLISAELFWLDDLHDELIWCWRHFSATHTVMYSVYINRPLSWCFFEKLRAFNEFEVEELRIGVDVHPCCLGEQLQVHVHRVTRRQTQQPPEVPVPTQKAAAEDAAPKPADAPETRLAESETLPVQEAAAEGAAPNCADAPEMHLDSASLDLQHMSL